MHNQTSTNSTYTNNTSTSAGNWQNPNYYTSTTHNGYNNNYYTNTTSTGMSNMGTSGTTLNIYPSIHNEPTILIPYELMNIFMKEIEKLTEHERSIINDKDKILEIIKNNKIKITIEIAEEEMI